jgi:small subunit ribosomal protein S4e
MLHKLQGIWAPRPSTGPHKLRESLPLVLVLRNRLKYALTRREVTMITNRRLVEVDGKVRTDTNYPVGFMDVVTLPRASEQFRVMYDHKGRFILHPVKKEEGSFKLLRVQRVSKGKKGSIGHNPFQLNQASAIPFAVSHDGRTIRYPDPRIKTNDSVKWNIAEQKVTGIIRFEVGALATITRGANTGRVGHIHSIEKHPGSFDIVHLKDKKGNQFATRLHNVFVIGSGNTPAVTLPSGNGIRLSLMEEREETKKHKLQAEKRQRKQHRKEKK